MKTTSIIIAFWLSFALAAAPVAAQPFDEVAARIDARYQQARQEKRLTLADIARQRTQLADERSRLQDALAAVTRELAQEQARLEDLDRRRDALKEQLSVRLAGMKELNALLADYARRFLALAEESPFSAEAPKRLETLKALAAADGGAGLDAFKTLFGLYFEDMAASAQKIAYDGTVTDRAGEGVEVWIVRLGHMAAFYRTADAAGYLMPGAASGRLLMGAAPPYRVRRQLEAYIEGRQPVVPMDISGGVAVRQLARHVTLAEQLRSGGLLVVPILLVGLVVVGLTVERLIFLGKVRHNTDDLMTRVTGLVDRDDFEGALEATRPYRNRPTGRVLMAGLAHRGGGREVIESALSEAILKETPRLERFLGALKVSAAVAPLLGLLGTVTGMINTFQVITTHGTGDPRLMAGGISEAMVTTQVGLAVAIPAMLIAAFLGRRVHTIARDMEEKGLALMGALLSSKNQTVP